MKKATILLIILISTCCFGVRMGDYFKMLDSSANGFDYAYAPCMIYDRDAHKIHCWVGSSGTGENDWDHIRYIYSTNAGASWSTPVDQIQGCNYDRCACDPAVVQWTDGYWYNFYSGNILVMIGQIRQRFNHIYL